MKTKVERRKTTSLMIALVAAGVLLLLTVTVVQGQEPAPPGPGTELAALTAFLPPVTMPLPEWATVTSAEAGHLTRFGPHSPQNGVGTVNYVQENGRRVSGKLSVGVAVLTVTLQSETGVVKSVRTCQTGDCIRDDLSYEVQMTTTIVASDTVIVRPEGGDPASIFVDPLTAVMDADQDIIGVIFRAIMGQAFSPK